MDKFFDIVPSWIYAIAIAVLLACLGAQALEVSAMRTKVSDVKREAAEANTAAAEKLAKETDRVLKLERTLSDVRTTQEKADAENRNTVTALENKLRASSRAAGGPGLRDPWAKPCTPTPTGPAPTATAAGGAGDPAPAAGLLSPELEQYLVDKFAQADRINVAYASCRPDALNVRAIINGQPAPAEAH